MHTFVLQEMAIMPNMHSVFTSDKYWDRPLEFRPERFIDSNGKLFNMEKFAPFGFGKRFCMGETQATPAIFLYFTSLMQRFEISKVPGDNPTTEPGLGFTLTPQPFDMIIKQRM